MSESSENFFYHKVMKKSGWIWLGSAFPLAFATAPTGGGIQLGFMSLIGFAIAIWVARSEGHERSENGVPLHEAHGRDESVSDRP